MLPFPTAWPVAAAHPPRYRWHKYWGRKPYNVVAHLLEHHLPQPGRMLDLFCGSGVAATEALILGHQAVAMDLNPAAMGILVQTAGAPDLAAMDAAVQRLTHRLAAPIEALYRTICRGCGVLVGLDCLIWSGGEPSILRYRCTACGRRALEDPLREEDRTLAVADHGATMPEWPLSYDDGRPYVESQGAGTVGDLLWPRARLGLSWLLAAIASEEPSLQPALRQIVTSMVHLVSRLCPVPKPGKTNHATPFSSFWAQHSFNRPATAAMEQPVWAKFRDAYSGHQGWRKAQLDVIAVGGGWPVAVDPHAWLAGEGRLLAMTGPARASLAALALATDGPCLDLVFADPPYGGTIQYGELSSLWNAFLLDHDRAEDHRRAFARDEVGCNKAQGKDLAAFSQDLQAHFQAVRPLMRPEAPAIVTFHSPKGALRHAAIGAIVRAGFRLVGIQHNAGARMSAKACQQPFGSVEGDFWLVFTPDARPPVAEVGVDWASRTVTLAGGLLRDAAEPLPYTELINRLEPVLAAAGFFAAETAPVALDTVLKQASQSGALRLVEGDVAGVRGWLWAASAG